MGVAIIARQCEQCCEGMRPLPKMWSPLALQIEWRSSLHKDSRTPYVSCSAFAFPLLATKIWSLCSHGLTMKGSATYARQLKQQRLSYPANVWRLSFSIFVESARCLTSWQDTVSSPVWRKRALKWNEKGKQLPVIFLRAPENFFPMSTAQLLQHLSAQRCQAGKGLISMYQSGRDSMRFFL